MSDQIVTLVCAKCGDSKMAAIYSVTQRKRKHPRCPACMKVVYDQSEARQATNAPASSVSFSAGRLIGKGSNQPRGARD